MEQFDKPEFVTRRKRVRRIRVGVVVALLLAVLGTAGLVVAGPARAAAPADADDRAVVSMIAQDAWFDVSPSSQAAACDFYYTHSSYQVYRKFRSAYAGMGISGWDIRLGLQTAFSRIC